MPLYDFECKNEHTFELFLSISDRDNKIKCEECGTVAKRITGTVSPPIVDPSKIMRNKPKLGSDFIQRMKTIQKKHPGNTIKSRWN